MPAKSIPYPYFVHHNRSEWMKGVLYGLETDIFLPHYRAKGI